MWEKLRKKAKAIRLEGTTEDQASRVIGHKALDLCFNPLAHGFKKRRKITYCFRWQHVINLLAWPFSHCKTFSNKLYTCQVQLVLRQHGFELYGSPYMQISFNTYLYCFWPAVGHLWMQRASCVHWSAPFYREALSIHGFLVFMGVLESIAHGYWGTT